MAHTRRAVGGRVRRERWEGGYAAEGDDSAGDEACMRAISSRCLTSSFPRLVASGITFSGDWQRIMFEVPG